MWENKKPCHQSYIILCYNCKGSGTISVEKLVDYHRREYDTEYHDCPHCDGSGRLKETITVVYEKYNKLETVE